METTLEDQAELLADPLVGDQTDPIDTNQEDDFDFEIGGDDGFDLTAEAGNEDGGLVDEVDVTQDYVDQSDMLQSQEQEPQALVTGNDAGYGDDDGHQEIGVSSSGLDSLHTRVELTQDFQNGIEKDEQNDSHNDLGVADQEEMENNAKTLSEEEIYYEETAGEFADLDHTPEPGLMQDQGLMNAATSVGHVHEGDNFQDHTNEADDDDVETADNDAQDFQLVAETVQKVEVAEDSEPEDRAQPANGAAEAEISEARDDSADATLANNDGTDDVVAANLDQSNWADEDDDHDGSNASPIVTVSYRGQEYSMFAQSPEDDPDTYFLDGAESIHRPLSQFLEEVREIISSEVEAGHELFARIDGLGLEFGESTAKDFLDQTTLAQIIEVNDKLSQNDGGSQHAELYIFLSIRSNPKQRFAELAKGADEGHGLSYFEQYYEESPADVSLFDEEEQHGVSQNISSDLLSQEGSPDENQKASDVASNALNAKHDHNLFQIDDQQLSLNDAAISEILGAETETFETEADDNTAEASIFDGNVNDSSDVAQKGDVSSFDLATRDAEVIDGNDNFGDAISVAEQGETEMVEGWDHNENVDAQDELGSTAREEAIDEQAELLINESEEGREHSDDATANIPNDEDYLDLSENAENQAATTDANAAEQDDIQQRTTPNSSATATLNGEENGPADEAAAIQDRLDSVDQTHDPINQNQDDEIDWNHEDDDDIGVANQNPTDLSPSSLSAKRNRQEDEGIDGLGDDSAAKRRRT